ncbi:hypothetical protein Pan216_05210 [Planctomycetes bacterium Pan216]|uniref:Carbohydrate-binding domain-containing protein n=1 Tax=Kolteria novifilia TaxID=2527975 RepID=A0A518AY88_9BACT|nr:hypothetical protein Pan216_05210 [Planctomycetes bacterium Pan216]
MAELIPKQFLFRFTLACPKVARMPTKGNHIVDLPDQARLPHLGEMDGLPHFADLWMGWNEQGLGLAWRVWGKTEPIHGESDRPKSCDGLSLWLDTRDTRTIHRASRYCQRLTIAVHDGGSDGLPSISQQKIHRANEEAPQADLSSVRLARHPLDEEGEFITTSKGKPAPIRNYQMEAFLPAAVLSGFDPDVNRRLGFFVRIRDHELGDQISGTGPEFPYWEDPSLWLTLELVDG